MLIENPIVPGMGTIKLRIHRGAIDWHTKAIEVIYELVAASESVVNTGYRTVEGIDLGLEGDALTESLCTQLGFKLVQ